MADATFWKGLTLWLSGFAVLALVAAGGFAFLFFGAGQSPQATDDLRVHNGDDANHTLHVEILAENGSVPVFSERVVLAPDERRSFENATAQGRAYRLAVRVDDRPQETFEVTGPDDLCTIEVEVDANATVETVTSCA